MRAPSMANQIADAVTAACRRINATLDAGKWLTVPAEVRRGFLVESINARRPALLIEVGEWSDQQMVGPRHETRMQVLVHCVSEGTELGERLLNDMAADVIRAISDDHALGGLAVDATPTNYRPETEIAQRSALGIATLYVQVDYYWSHGSP